VADPRLSEDEELEQLKEWWKKNGSSLVIGVLVAVIGFFGWRYYSDSQAKTKELASRRFDSLRDLMLKHQAPQIKPKSSNNSLLTQKVKPNTAIRKIKEEHGSTPYAIDSALLLAKLKAEQGDLKTAAKELKWVLDNTDSGSYKNHLARLRYARVMRDQKQYDQALGLLNIKQQGTFDKHYEFVKGSIYEQQKKCGPARQAYQKSIDSISKEEARLKKTDLPKQAEVMNLLRFRILVENRLENVKNC
jgi:predicted negative regulator of RcsB-dependent stress response